ncbi:MAG: hypothetical protein IKK86_06160 [Alistipes sp.]|nr:hypothetical protein [Alistipes sp.]
MQKFMVLVAAAFVMMACSKEEAATIDNVQYVTELKATLGGGDETRMVYTHDPSKGLSFAWEDGDVLKLFQADDPTVWPKSYAYKSSTKKFHVIGTDAMEAGKQYFAAPHQLKTSTPYFDIVDGKPVLDLYLDAAKTVADIPLISDVFTATTDGTIATMHHTVGVVEIPVKVTADSQFKSLMNNGFRNDVEIITGQYTVTAAPPYFVEAVGTSGVVTAMANEGKELSTTTATSFFVPMLPGVYTNCTLNYIYIQYQTNDPFYINSVKVVCGKITKLDEITLELN